MIWCRNEQVCQGVKCRLKRFERSNGLDTALYNNYLYLFNFFIYPVANRLKFCFMFLIYYNTVDLLAGAVTLVSFSLIRSELVEFFPPFQPLHDYP